MELGFDPNRSLAQVLRGWRYAGLEVLPLPNAPSTSQASAADSLAVTSAEVAVEASPSARTAVKKGINSEMPRQPRSENQSTSIETSHLIWPDPKPMSIAARMELLAPIRGEVAACTLCKELAATRTQTVFGVGNVRPQLCFFGEAPGADEDKQGEPFVGRAGQLLDKIIEAMTLKREDVYILNTLKCRPPGNRTPLPDEVENCRCFFTRQLEVLRPEFLVCLGACAAQALLRTKESIGKLRGRSHDFRGIKVYATYHPAYLLRNPPAKRDVWEDMKIVMQAMGIAVPKA
jgi:uracil-DNA glycosylase family 4